MARRKSVPAQLYATYKKNKKAKEQAERRAQRELAQWEQQQLREAEREEAQRRRQADQAEREARRREVEAERDRHRQAEEARRAEAQRQRDLARAAGQRRREDAERERGALTARVAELAGILAARPRELRTRSMALERAFGANGAEALATLVEKELADSPYPAGFPRTAKVMFAPESRELLINYDLPRQDVIPDVADYKVARGRDELQPVPRKDAEIKKLYGDVIARTALRTLAEVFGQGLEVAVDGAQAAAVAECGDLGVQHRGVVAAFVPAAVQMWLVLVQDHRQADGPGHRVVAAQGLGEPAGGLAVNAEFAGDGRMPAAGGQGLDSGVLVTHPHPSRDSATVIRRPGRAGLGVGGGAAVICLRQERWRATALVACSARLCHKCHLSAT